MSNLATTFAGIPWAKIGGWLVKAKFWIVALLKPEKRAAGYDPVDAIGPCEQSIFPVERDGDGAFDGVVVELDAAVVDEAG